MMHNGHNEDGSETAEGRLTAALWDVIVEFAKGNPDHLAIMRSLGSTTTHAVATIIRAGSLSPEEADTLLDLFCDTLRRATHAEVARGDATT